ncbi:MAG: insulinase family protein, partial [Bacteroidota bacterium]
PVLAKQNTENELFELTYLLDLGKNADRKLAMAVQYLEFLGTDQYDAEAFKKELYKLGCSFNVFASTERTYVTLSGLNDNMEEATALFESLLANAQPDQDALDKMVDRSFKSRSDAKKNKGRILWDGLYNYGKYGKENPYNDVLSNYEMKELKAEELVSIIKGITKLPHRILYYGPRSSSDFGAFIASAHNVPESFDAIPELKTYAEVDIEKPKVFWTDYDMVQSEIVFLAKGNTYDAQKEPAVRMFNEYFGGGMNSIVFQEIREAQGLAYSVFSSFSQPSKQEKSNYIFAYVGTQADKQSEAMDAMMDLLNNLPESESAFEVAKGAILNKIESERVTGSGVLWNYINAQDKGLEYDIRKDIYNDVQNMSFDDLSDFHQKYVKDQDYITVMVGSRDRIDFNSLQEYGEITEVPIDELFGYEDPEQLISK